MEDLANNPQQPKAQPQARPTLKFDFEEDLKRQNINTMFEIFGEEYMAKIDHLTQ
jgi:hypothetical protein